MSRIHEALKRAEQESKGAPAAAVAPTEGESYLDDVLIGSAGAPRSNAVESAVVSAVKENGTTQNWLEEVPRLEWKPDPKKLLFSDPNRHYEPGMEEFRTLRSRLYQLREKTASEEDHDRKCSSGRREDLCFVEPGICTRATTRPASFDD